MSIHDLTAELIKKNEGGAFFRSNGNIFTTDMSSSSGWTDNDGGGGVSSFDASGMKLDANPPGTTGVKFASRYRNLPSGGDGISHSFICNHSVGLNTINDRFDIQLVNEGTTDRVELMLYDNAFWYWTGSTAVKMVDVTIPIGSGVEWSVGNIRFLDDAENDPMLDFFKGDPLVHAGGQLIASDLKFTTFSGTPFEQII